MPTWCVAPRDEQRHDGDVDIRAQLTREPDVGPRADAFEGSSLILAGRRASTRAADHAHSAGGAACTAPALGAVRNAETATRFEHRPTARHPDRPLGIADRNPGLPPAFEQQAQSSRHNSQAYHSEICGEQTIADACQGDAA